MNVADVTITRNSAPPTWAKYYQLVRTKNLDKDFVYEGFPTGVYFMTENEEGTFSTAITSVNRSAPSIRSTGNTSADSRAYSRGGIDNIDSREQSDNDERSDLAQRAELQERLESFGEIDQTPSESISLSLIHI